MKKITKKMKLDLINEISNSTTIESLILRLNYIFKHNGISDIQSVVDQVMNEELSR